MLINLLPFFGQFLPHFVSGHGKFKHYSPAKTVPVGQPLYMPRPVAPNPPPLTFHPTVQRPPQTRDEILRAAEQIRQEEQMRDEQLRLQKKREAEEKARQEQLEKERALLAPRTREEILAAAAKINEERQAQSERERLLYLAKQEEMRRQQKEQEQKKRKTMYDSLFSYHEDIIIDYLKQEKGYIVVKKQDMVVKSSPPTISTPYGDREIRQTISTELAQKRPSETDEFDPSTLESALGRKKHKSTRASTTALSTASEKDRIAEATTFLALKNPNSSGLIEYFKMYGRKTRQPLFEGGDGFFEAVANSTEGFDGQAQQVRDGMIDYATAQRNRCMVRLLSLLTQFIYIICTYVLLPN